MFRSALHKKIRRIDHDIGTSMVAAAMALAIGAMSWPAIASNAQGSNAMDNVSKTGVAPVIAEEGSIDLAAVEGDSKVTAISMTYSPDGNYLAIVDAVGAAATHIVVWDLKRNTLQSHTERLAHDFALNPYAVLTWTPDGKRLTFGNGGGRSPIQFWDAMTGRTALEAPSTVVAASLRFNRQGTQALASPGAGGSSTFRVYDTVNWNYKEFDEGGLAVQEVAWAPNNQIVAVGIWRQKGGADAKAAESAGRDLKINDLVGRLIDISGATPGRTKLLIPSKTATISGGGRGLSYNQSQQQSPMFLASDADGKTLAIGLGNILDVPAMEMHTYASGEDIGAHKVPAALQPRNLAISPDGSYLYLSGGSYGPNGANENLVVDAKTGQLLRGFHGGKEGIAVSPDGRKVAVGDRQYVKFFHVN